MASLPIEGLSLSRYAERSGLSVGFLQYLCGRGLIVGARRHPLTKRWRIFPPGHLLLPRRAYRPSSVPHDRSRG